MRHCACFCPSGGTEVWSFGRGGEVLAVMLRVQVRRVFLRGLMRRQYLLGLYVYAGKLGIESRQ